VRNIASKIIKNKSSNTFSSRVFVGRDSNGKQLFKYLTKPSEKELRSAIREVEQQIEDGTYQASEGARIGPMIDKWFELNESRLSPTTARVYKFYLHRFKIFFGGMKLSSITSTHVKEFLKILRDGGKLGEKQLRKQSGTSQLKQYCVLNMILEEFLKGKNPCRDVKAPVKDRPEMIILTVNEFKKVKEHVKNTRDELTILLAAACGMRLGEVYGLRWQDIDFKNELIKIRNTMVKVDKEYIQKKPKSKSGIRDIIAGDEILGLLKRYQKTKGVISGLVIQDDYPDRCSKRYETVIKKLGLPKTRFHDLRHYRATRMLAAGIPDILTSQQLGHSDVSMTKRYQHNTADIISNSKSKIKKLL